MTYDGGCHCGAVRFRADVDLTHVMTCNCSHCAKKGFVLTFVPAAQFALAYGADALTEYRFNTRKIAHLFCNVCGVESFARGADKDGNETVMINVRCLDGVDTTTLAPAAFDGRSL